MNFQIDRYCTLFRVFFVNLKTHNENGKLLTRKNERSLTVIISNLSALKHNVTAALAIPTRWPRWDGEERHVESQTHRLDGTTRNMHTPHTPHPRPKGHSPWTVEVFISLFHTTNPSHFCIFYVLFFYIYVLYILFTLNMQPMIIFIVN